MAADVGTDADTIRRFFAAAGVAQYTDKLIDEGFDSLSTLLTIDETGLQDLKAAAGMKPGHLAALRAKIGQEAPLGAPLRAAAAPLPITPTAAAAPACTSQPARVREANTYVPAAGDHIAAMARKFETKYSQDKYGNCMDTYTNSKDNTKLYDFIGKSTNSVPVGQPVYRCACTPTVVYINCHQLSSILGNYTS